ncbi:penicillin acylase family protein [Catenuloplanes japonicus]|uniref:penicillin acylase family protein n=1 Tax=Catenuloplanes japonicus TaxID=33876 RepID=UPI000A0FB2C7|nr:penicillin acylase family protein [Catenuloplanes japonicus]
MRPPLTLLRLLGRRSLRATRPSGRIDAAGVRQQVVIDRDERGVPWVQAGAEPDLYFGLGYAMAADRLWQMDVLRRRAHGGLAEVLGPSLIDQDVLARTLSFSYAAERSLTALPSQAAENLDAFAAGVNHLIRRLRRRAALPVEFQLLRYRPEPWTAVDSVAIIKQLGFGLGRNLHQELFRDGLAARHPHLADVFSVPRYPQGGTTTLGRPGPDTRPAPPAAPVTSRLPDSSRAWLSALLTGQRTGGSNGWVVGGAMSRTGGPMLANDPHIAFTQPNLWYQVGLRLGPDIGYGVTVPGIPGLVAGTNRDIAWGITNATADTQDLFAITDADHRPPEWTRPQVITVRGGAPVTVTASGGPGYVLLAPSAGLYWSGFFESTEAETCQRMWRARSWGQFREVLRGFGVPVLNFVLAAADGTVGFQTAGIIPRRRAADGVGVSSRADAERRWRAPLSFDELPESTGDAGSVYVTANHKIIPDGRPPHLGADWGGPYRADRITDLIRRAAPGIAAADHGRWQMDTVNGRAVRVLPALLTALAAHPPARGPAAGCYDILARWDCRDDAAQPAPLIFAALMRQLADRWVHTPLGRDLTVLMTDVTLQVDHLVLDDAARKHAGENEPLPAVVGHALAAAAASLANTWGPDPAQWRFGDLNRIRDRHPLAAAVPGLRAFFGDPDTPVSGGGQTVCLMYPTEDGSVTEGAPWRFVVCFGADGPLIQDSLRHGASGNPASRHYDDQTMTHTQGRLHTVPLDGPASPTTRLTIRAPRWPAT